MYKAVLFAPDGDWVSDFANSHSIDDVWDHLSNIGIKWSFYPLHFVIEQSSDDATYANDIIVDASPGYEGLKGLTVAEVKTYFKNIFG